MPCTLLTTPVELLVQHILARLDLLTLRSCSSACKHLNLIIKTSALLQDLIKLQEMNLIDNPTISCHKIPLASQLEMLREYGVRQKIKWQLTAPPHPSQLLGPHSIKGETGVLYLCSLNPEAQVLHWTTLPSTSDQAIEWNILHPPSAVSAAHALSIEENDLIAVATWHGGPILRIQTHLFQHSTQLPYPGLASPILDICDYQRLAYAGDHPVVKLAICGTNLAVMVGHESFQEIMDQEPSEWIGHLSVWNWKTGEKKCEKKCIPDKDMGLVFLREDILLHGSSLDMSLNIYLIPMSTASAGDHDLRLIDCLELPRPEKDLNDHPEFNVDISFSDNPAVVPSFTETSNPTADSLSSILSINVTFNEYAGDKSYFFITHYQTLLGRAEHALSCYKNGQDDAASSVPWEEWGPDVTRMFWYNYDLDSLDAPYGSQLFIQSNNLIEVFDFGRADGTNIPNQGHEETQTPSALRWLVEQDDYGQGIWFRDIVHTKLPFARRILSKGPAVISGNWDKMYVDCSMPLAIVWPSFQLMTSFPSPP